jgi:hypothetical protein
MRKPVVVLGSLALLTVALHLRDPHERGSWAFCPTALLGFSCPGCGGLRAVNDLTHGQVGAAASSNLALLVAMPFMVVALAVWTLDRWRGTHTRLPARLTRVLGPAALVLLACFTVLRNLPAGSWLAP